MIHRSNNGKFQLSGYSSTFGIVISLCLSVNTTQTTCSFSEPPVNTTPHQLMSKVTHTNGSIPLNDVAGASDEGLSPAKPLSGVEGCQQPSLADVASQILLSLPIVKKEGRGYTFY